MLLFGAMTQALFAVSWPAGSATGAGEPGPGSTLQRQAPAAVTGASAGAVMDAGRAQLGREFYLAPNVPPPIPRRQTSCRSTNSSFPKDLT